ncbi:MAG: hypothetical protein U1D30_19100 [Planctomycetota bacterium]
MIGSVEAQVNGFQSLSSIRLHLPLPGVGGPVNRVAQITFVILTLVGSWLGMQAIHEFGHVVGAWVTRGEVERVVLHPLTISRTDLRENPHPLVVVWAGPVLGVLIPLSLWWIASAMRLSIAYLPRFFAGFCLIANGAYIGLGAWDRIGDCGEMLKQGSSIWLLWLFGGMTIPIGLWLWHGQGGHFGFGSNKRPIRGGVVLFAFLTCVVLLAQGIWLSHRC